MTSDGSDNGPHGPGEPERDRPAQDRPFAPPPEPSKLGPNPFPVPDPNELQGSTAPDAAETPETTEQIPRRGSVRNQDRESTKPRPPTVAEARARDKARRRAAEEEEAQQLAADKKRKRNRRLIGGAAVVGLVGVVALGYSALKPDEVTASCVKEEDGKQVVVEDQVCEDAQRANGGGGFAGGFIFLGGSQYRYYYGGNQTVGQPPTGGTTTAPKGTSVKTKSGTTIQRGGLGSKIGGSSGS